MDEWSKNATEWALISGLLGWLLLDSIIWAFLLAILVGYLCNEDDKKKREND